MTYRKKLIEVALPLDEINAASAREKAIRHGHPSTLHLWWARRPLAACRAVLFASLVDDPSSDPSLSESEQEVERERLFQIIRDLVKWENSNNEDVLQAARDEILRCTDGNPPPVLDPFCGGGSIPLEAQRLGLEAHASDLNPVAVLITKAMIEIPPKFAGLPPVNPKDRKGTAQGGSWPRATGLAADVRHYGEWMRDEAFKRIGHLYPKATLPDGSEATVIAWLWARTVTCPNPACGAEMPLIRSFDLSTKKGKAAWVEPVVDQTRKTVRFEVKTGNGKAREGTVERTGATCIVCGTSVGFPHIRQAGKNHEMGADLLAVVADSPRGRAYISPSDDQLSAPAAASPEWTPIGEISHWPGRTNVVEYGMTEFADLFTPRQLVALTTFSDLVGEARKQVLADAIAAGRADDGVGIEAGGTGAQAYADAVATYLAFAVDKLADYDSTICTWHIVRETIGHTFTRQAIPMTWDFAEVNPFSDSTGNIGGALDWVRKSVESVPALSFGTATQSDASKGNGIDKSAVISTDPPYYDNIGYADLSDYFYVWMRRALAGIYTSLLSTRLTPKSEELIASPHRHDGSKVRAQTFFESGLARTFRVMHDQQDRSFPMTVYYAYKQEDLQANEGAVSTGWETMLQGLMDASLSVTGTWPLRTEMSNRILGLGSNALASSIAIVCRPRSEMALVASRRDFINALRAELETALIELQHASIAPVDLAQASIGPGMRVFSQYARVLEPDGSAMRVRTALQLINQELDQTLASVEGDLDPDSRFCVAWFEENGFSAGQYGQADVLARAKNTTVGGLEQSGVLVSASGKVQLKRPGALQEDWDPVTDRHTNIWECTHQLIRILESEGELAAGAMLAKLGGDIRERVKTLSYRLYGICDRKKWSDLALAYNALGQSWNEIQRTAESLPAESDQTPKQAGLL